MGTAQRVEEDGKSESRPVMGRIGVAPREGNITPRESGQTSVGSLITGEFGEPTQEAEQMTAKNELAGAASRRG
jgi:hypothetical protein